MTVQHRMTKAHPLACNCKPGWFSSFQHEPTHPLAWNCETGWVFFLLFFKSTNADDDDEPCRLAVIICLHLHPRQVTTQQPTPSLAIVRQGGFFSSFFLRQRTTTTGHVGSLSSSASVCTHDNNDNPPPCLQLRDRVGFYHSFFQVNEHRRRRG